MGQDKTYYECIGCETLRREREFLKERIVELEGQLQTRKDIKKLQEDFITIQKMIHKIEELIEEQAIKILQLSPENRRKFINAGLKKKSKKKKIKKLEVDKEVTKEQEVKPTEEEKSFNPPKQSRVEAAYISGDL